MQVHEIVNGEVDRDEREVNVVVAGLRSDHIPGIMRLVVRERDLLFTRYPGYLLLREGVLDGDLDGQCLDYPA